METSSIPFFENSGMANVDNLDLVAGRVALVFACSAREGSFGVKETADRLLPDLLAVPAPAGSGSRRRRPRSGPPARVGSSSPPGGMGRVCRSFAAGLLLPPARAGCATPGSCARTTAGRELAFPLGAICAGRRSSRWPRSPSSTTAPTSTCSTPSCGAGSPIVLGVAFLGFLDDALGPGRRRPTRRAAGAATRARCRRAALDRRDQGGRRARRWRPRRLAGAGREAFGVPGRRRAARPRDEPLQPAGPAAGPGREGVRAARRRALPRRVDGGAAGGARRLRRRRCWSAPGSPCVSRRCSATRART